MFFFIFNFSSQPLRLIFPSSAEVKYDWRYTSTPSIRLHDVDSEIFIKFIFNYALQPFKAYCAILVKLSNFRHKASPRVSPRESTQRRKVELWARNVR
jgi:hypothetical protein